MVSPPVERVTPLPLPVAVLLPIWPREASHSDAMDLLVAVTVGVVLQGWEGSVGIDLIQLGAEELFEVPARLGHL